MAKKRDWSKARFDKKVVVNGFTPSFINGPISNFRPHQDSLAITTTAHAIIADESSEGDIAELRLLFGSNDISELSTIVRKGITTLVSSGDYRLLERAYFLIPNCTQRDKILNLIESNLGISIRKTDCLRFEFIPGEKAKHKTKFRVDLMERKVCLLFGEKV
jgi:hypothetical protein